MIEANSTIQSLAHSLDPLSLTHSLTHSTPSSSSLTHSLDPLSLAYSLTHSTPFQSPTHSLTHHWKRRLRPAGHVKGTVACTRCGCACRAAAHTWLRWAHHLPGQWVHTTGDSKRGPGIQMQQKLAKASKDTKRRQKAPRNNTQSYTHTQSYKR